MLGDDEIATLRKKLEETQRTMEQIIAKVGNVPNEIKDPIDTIPQEHSEQLSSIHSDDHVCEREKTGDEYKKIEPWRQELSDDGSTHLNCEVRNKYNNVSSGYCADETVDEISKTTDNVELKNAFEETGNQQSESRSSNNSISSHSYTSGDGDSNIDNVSEELGETCKNIQNEATEFGDQFGQFVNNQFGDEVECSDSDDEVNKYDIKCANDETMYEDESSQYPDDKRQYFTSDQFDCEVK